MRGCLILLSAMMLAAIPGRTWAAGSAYQVDTSEVSEAGSCKVESWLSAASNHDFIAVTNPSCAFDLFKPTELSVQALRQRSDGDWSTTFTPKAKVRASTCARTTTSGL